jgi:prephenate dehydratase
MFADQDIATQPSDSLQGVFDALADEQCEYGVCRVENSERGTSYEVLDLLRATRVYFAREIRFHEQYNLAGQAGAKPEDIKRIYTHPAIFNLCSGYLSRLEGVEFLARFDGAENLASLVQRGDKSEATIVGDFAASIFGLKVIQPAIENSVTGVTRFVALSKAKRIPETDSTKCTTTIMFELKHKPGALMDALAAFRKNDINLTSVFARPNRSNKWDYTVFVEFAGTYEDEKNRTALAELKTHTTYLQLIGSFDTVEPTAPKS